jgi:hypothetical protein
MILGRGGGGWVGEWEVCAGLCVCVGVCVGGGGHSHSNNVVVLKTELERNGDIVVSLQGCECPILVDWRPAYTVDWQQCSWQPHCLRKVAHECACGGGCMRA